MSRLGSPQVLFVDAYDSFTNNIISLLETRLSVLVTVIKLDASIEDLTHFIGPYSAIVLGPGPGDPRNDKDVGLFRRFWQLNDENVVPVLGICLGFQSLVLAFGGNVACLREPRHGLVRRIRHNGRNIFEGTDPRMKTVQYHSLYATLGPQDLLDSDNSAPQFHKPCQPSADLVELAFDCEADNISAGAGTSHPSANPEYILMAVAHRSKPFHGIQFHPESICSSSSAQAIIVDWWQTVEEWWKGRTGNARHRHRRRRSQHMRSDQRLSGQPRGTIRPKRIKERMASVLSKVISYTKLTVPAICSRLGLAEQNVVVLDSENHLRDEVGQHSIVGLISSESLRLEYKVGTTFVRKIHNGRTTYIDLSRKYHGDIFRFLQEFVRQHQAQSTHIEIPFWGGLIGYISYENCLETIGIGSLSAQHSHRTSAPDLSFVFIERSIVIAHLQRKIYVQSLIPTDHPWVETTATSLATPLPHSPLPTPFSSLDARVTLPHESSYKARIRAAQAHIRAGNSYELCLTNRATIRTPIHLPSWPLYLRLRQLNPAPFAAYLNLRGLTLLSSSPERFLSWTRPFGRRDERVRESICQFRPIKGTIARQPDPKSPPLTLEQAELLLATAKEKAENLMIVDLIRHDLHGVVGSGNVSVPKLMVVEEYKTLYQLVSVIEGVIHIRDDLSEEDSSIDRGNSTSRQSSRPRDAPSAIRSPSNAGNKRGIDVLAASLPPGSMTGAPKLRSCQLLQEIEGKPRGVYSGLVGYLDVGGGGDFSVVIRSAVRWDKKYSKPFPADESNEASNDEEVDPTRYPNGNQRSSSEREDVGDMWTIGAGGAITALSAEDGEYEEMMTKLRSTLRIFEDETTTYDFEAQCEESFRL